MTKIGNVPSNVPGFILRVSYGLMHDVTADVLAIIFVWSINKVLAYVQGIHQLKGTIIRYMVLCMMLMAWFFNFLTVLLMISKKSVTSFKQSIYYNNEIYVQIMEALTYQTLS